MLCVICIWIYVASLYWYVLYTFALLSNSAKEAVLQALTALLSKERQGLVAGLTQTVTIWWWMVSTMSCASGKAGRESWRMRAAAVASVRFAAAKHCQVPPSNCREVTSLKDDGKWWKYVDIYFKSRQKLRECLSQASTVLPLKARDCKIGMQAILCLLLPDTKWRPLQVTSWKWNTYTKTQTATCSRKEKIHRKEVKCMAPISLLQSVTSENDMSSTVQCRHVCPLCCHLRRKLCCNALEMKSSRSQCPKCPKCSFVTKYMRSSDSHIVHLNPFKSCTHRRVVHL